MRFILKMSHTFSFVLVSLLMLPSATQAVTRDGPSDWTQWRGPNRDSRLDAEWPATLTEANLKLLWSKPFGPSYSGPIISGDTLFVTETRDKKEEVVTALDVQSGEPKWTAQWPGSMRVPFFAARNGSWIRSTPATDGQRIYVAGMLGRLVCLDNATGKIEWEIDFSERYGTKREDFGQVCSPLIVDADVQKDNAVYIQCSAGFLKLNRLTGEEIWRTLDTGGGMMSGGAFSSPFVATVAGKKQILVQTREELAGVDMDSGKVLWRQPVPNFRGMNILTPTCYKDTVFTSSYKQRSFGYQISAGGDGFTVTESWTAPSKAYMSSPVIIGDHVFMHLESKRLACLDLVSGETKWISKQRFGDYWSMVATDDKILALDSKGVLYLLKANPEKLEILGQVDLATNDSWAHVAIVGDRVFVRGLNSMAVYQWQSQARP